MYKVKVASPYNSDQAFLTFKGPGGVFRDSHLKSQDPFKLVQWKFAQL